MLKPAVTPRKFPQSLIRPLFMAAAVASCAAIHAAFLSFGSSGIFDSSSSQSARYFAISPSPFCSNRGVFAWLGSVETRHRCSSPCYCSNSNYWSVFKDRYASLASLRFDESTGGRCRVSGLLVLGNLPRFRICQCTLIGRDRILPLVLIDGLSAYP
jgi:hypothetical protein